MKKNLILILIIVLLGILLAYNAFDNKHKQTIEKEKTSEELIRKIVIYNQIMIKKLEMILIKVRNQKKLV